MAVEMTYADAICRALKEEMAKDPTIFTYGEDIAKQGGIFGQGSEPVQPFFRAAGQEAVFAVPDDRAVDPNR